MRAALVFMLLIFSQLTNAQHCPWDCSGMIQIHTNTAKETVYKMNPVLVDANKNIITDTMFGTGLDTYDRCDFLYFDDFVDNRAKKIGVHHWYQYDTVYHFAEGNYLVKYNYCKYQGQKLYLRFTDLYSKKYHYMEIPQSRRIHIHDYSHQLQEGDNAIIRKKIKNFIILMDCIKWSLSKKDCY